MSNGSPFIVAFSLIAIMLSVPVFAGLMSFSGYTKLNTETYKAIQSEDFNILTFSGFGTAMSFLIELSKFTVFNVGIWFGLIYLFFVVVSILVFIFWLRGIN